MDSGISDPIPQAVTCRSEPYLQSKTLNRVDNQGRRWWSDSFGQFPKCPKQFKLSLSRLRTESRFPLLLGVL